MHLSIYYKTQVLHPIGLSKTLKNAENCDRFKSYGCQELQQTATY